MPCLTVQSNATGLHLRVRLDEQHAAAHRHITNGARVSGRQKSEENNNTSDGRQSPVAPRGGPASLPRSRVESYLLGMAKQARGAVGCLRESDVREEWIQETPRENATHMSPSSA